MADLFPLGAPKIGGRTTWLTPFADAWLKKVGGVIHWGKAAKFLKPLVELHGTNKVLGHLMCYLNHPKFDPMYASLSHFAETFGAWSPKEIKLRSGIDDAEIVCKLRSLGKVRLGWGKWSIQVKFEKVGFDGLSDAERSELVMAWKTTAR